MLSKSTEAPAPAALPAGRMPLKMALLGALIDRPMSGYDIARVLNEGFALAWYANSGQVYTELVRMAGDGSVQAGPAGRRNRTPYEITERGKAEFRDWLINSEPSRLQKNETVFRSFFLRILPPDDQIAFLRNEAEFYKSRLPELERIAALWDHHPEDMKPEEMMSRIGLEAILRQLRAMAEWAEWAEEEVASGRAAARARRTFGEQSRAVETVTEASK